VKTDGTFRGVSLEVRCFIAKTNSHGCSFKIGPTDLVER